MSADRMKVVLCWHMHQPQYCDMASGEYQLPWTYLHAMKDYVDMAVLLEENENAKVVVNFAPILLEQIDDYVQQLKSFKQHGAAITDPLLSALASTTFPHHQVQRLELIRQCVRANAERLIKPHPQFQRLALMATLLEEDQKVLHYLGDQYLTDILVWYHLVWLAESAHRNDKRIQALVAKGQDFTLSDRHQLVEIITELISSVIPRYRLLAEQGRVELSMNPYAHPIVPLLLDLHSSYDAMPDADMPHARQYPGGEARANWHIEEGIAVFEKHFHQRPQGCWPSEGAVSTDTLTLFSQHGLRWAATGEAVLHNSLSRAERSHEAGQEQGVYRPYQVAGSDTACFFRDDGLSDLIGFTYSDWHGDDAANNFIEHLQRIADSCDEPGKRVVSIILDGENAWEHYPNNGYYFLSSLYKQLATHPSLEMTSFSESLDAGVEVAQLDSLVAGSWVYGTFSTWIGDKDKNNAWDLLIEAKRAFDVVMGSKHLAEEERQQARRQLALCEGSDWFWWFGDYNPAEAVSDFEYLFRLHIAHLYGILGVEAPEALAHSIAEGHGDPEGGGSMRRGQN